MKEKSMKLRFLVTLSAIWKHSDEDHRMNTLKLNKYLEPYGLDCTSRVLNDTVRVMREYGIDVRNKGQWDNQGIWIEDRPLPTSDLDKIIFAVTTNPHLTKEQATDILQSLKPLVTVYQENALQGFVDTDPSIKTNDKLIETYSIIREAIQNKRRITYTVDHLKYDKEAQTVSMVEEWPTLFTPKCIYQSLDELYMVGYNNTDRKIAAVNLKDIISIQMAFKHKAPNTEKINILFAGIDPTDYIPGKKKTVLYKGPVMFRCRGQYTEELYRRFGPPEGEVKMTERRYTTYPVKEAEITSETLFWLSQIENLGIRIEGPDELREQIQTYYEELGKKLVDRRLKAKENTNS